MLYSKKKTDGLTSQDQVRLIPPKNKKTEQVVPPQNKPVSQPTVPQQNSIKNQSMAQQKPGVKSVQTNSQSMSLVNMMLSQPSVNPIQSGTNSSVAKQETTTQESKVEETENHTTPEITRHTIPVSNAKKYEEIEKRNPFVKTLKNKFNLNV